MELVMKRADADHSKVSTTTRNPSLRVTETDSQTVSDDAPPPIEESSKDDDYSRWVIDMRSHEAVFKKGKAFDRTELVKSIRDVYNALPTPASKGEFLMSVTALHRLPTSIITQDSDIESVVNALSTELEKTEELKDQIAQNASCMNTSMSEQSSESVDLRLQPKRKKLDEEDGNSSPKLDSSKKQGESLTIDDVSEEDEVDE